MKNSVRSLSSIVLVVFILLLSGCSLIYKTNTEDTKVVDTTTDTDFVETKLISKSKELNAIDIASEYIINAKKLATYKYKDDPAVSYINISEFIKFMDGGIVDLNISKSDVMTISYTFNIPSELQPNYHITYTYEMTIDAENEVISYNDFDMVSNINVPTITQYETDLIVSDMEIIDDDPSVDINLALYNLDIVLFEDGYYIPLYLANLFFTGTTINVYEMNDYIYIIDDFSDLNELIDAFEIDSSKNASDISSHMNNYLALYFDYFYGLKDYKNIETYISILEDYDFEEKDTFIDLHKELERFIIKQNDLHTSLISAGYLDEYYTPIKPKSNKLSKYLTAYKNNQCYLRESEVSYRTYGDTFIIEVNEFSLDTKDLLKPAMEEAKKYDDIIIDVSCNPGGNLIGVIELLSYMTDEEIPVSYINPATGGKIIEYYDTTNNVFLDKNFYVYTTAATFSAANLFTSIVKDQGLGLVFGGKTSGGASAITYTVLPDGALIVNSSNFTLINKNDEVIEDGIDVDINYSYPIRWYDLIDDLTNIFVDSSEIVVNKNTGKFSVAYDFDIDRNLEGFDVTNYILSVYDYETNELLHNVLFTSDDFTYNMARVEGNVAYKVEVSVMFNIYNIAKEEIIFTDIIDDHSNSFDLYATEIPIGEKFDAYSYGVDDKDAFKFTVLESGLYRIELNEEKLLYNHSVFDENGNLIGEGCDFGLEPGVYYLVVSIHDVGDYSIKIRKRVTS